MEYEEVFEEIDRLWDEEYDPNLKDENAYCHKQSFSWGFQEGVDYTTRMKNNTSLEKLISLCPETIHLDNYADTYYTLMINPHKVSYKNDKNEWIYMKDEGDLYDMMTETIKWLKENGYIRNEDSEILRHYE